jgi:hypothetical protein
VQAAHDQGGITHEKRRNCDDGDEQSKPPQRTVQEQREADDKKYSGCDSKSHAAEEEPSRPNRPRNEKNRLRNSVPPATFVEAATKIACEMRHSQSGRRENYSFKSSRTNQSGNSNSTNADQR